MALFELSEIKHKYERRLAYYQSRHRTVGCKFTHMFGIPMIALSIPVLFFNRKLALKMHLGGWILQLIGALRLRAQPASFTRVKRPARFTCRT